MKHILDISHSTKGETLVESIVAFLIITIILLGFTSMALLGSKLNLNASTTDVAANTLQSQTGTSKASIGEESVPDTVYKYSNDYIGSYSTSGTVTPPDDPQMHSIIFYGIKFVFQGDGNKSVVDSGETSKANSEASEIIQAMLTDSTSENPNYGGHPYDLSKIGWKMIASKDGSDKYVDLFLYLKSPITKGMIGQTIYPVYAYRYIISNWTDDTKKLTIDYTHRTAIISVPVVAGDAQSSYGIMNVTSAVLDNVSPE